jgi:hypothetical protein
LALRVLSFTKLSQFPSFPKIAMQKPKLKWISNVAVSMRTRSPGAIPLKSLSGVSGSIQTAQSVFDV